MLESQRPDNVEVRVKDIPLDQLKRGMIVSETNNDPTKEAKSFVARVSDFGNTLTYLFLSVSAIWSGADCD